MARQLSILLISHHRRARSYPRPHAFGRSLVHRGHEVTLIVTADQRKIGVTESIWDGVRMIEAPDLLYGRSRSGWDPWGALNRIRFLAAERRTYDIVHCFETRPATIYPALFYLRKNRLPFVIDWNDWWGGPGGIIDEMRPWWWRASLGWMEAHYEEHFRRFADRTTTITNALAERAARLGIPENTIRVVPGGVDTSLFRVSEKEACRRRLGISAASHVIGFSSFDSFYDIEVVLQAVRKLKSKHHEIVLLITGSAPRRVLTMLENYGLVDSLFLAGLVPYEELPTYLGCVDVFALPMADKAYSWGKWPNRIGEYMAVGRPTVANPVGDIRTLFEQKQVGVLCDYDPDSFAAAIEALLLDPDWANRLGARARQVAVEEYDWNVLIKDVESLYLDAIQTRVHTNPERLK